MKCLLLPDELEAFRPVAAAFQEQRVEFVILREFQAARIMLDLIDFDAIIVGANAIDSPALQFLKQCKPADMPVLGVTCAPWMCEELAAAGADRVLLLPNQIAHLNSALVELQKQSMRGCIG